MYIEVTKYLNSWGYTIFEKSGENVYSNIGYTTEEAAKKAAWREKTDLIKERIFAKLY